MSESIPQIGAPAPNFSLPDADQAMVGLSDFSGKWIVLYFYPRDNTSGCTTEALEFTALLPEFDELGAVVVGISKDSAQSHGKFRDKHGLKVRLLADEEKMALTAYGAWRMKKNYGKESMGTVRGTFLIGPDGILRASWPKVSKAAGHARAVLDALRELA